VLGPQFHSKLEGDLWWVTLEMELWSQPTRLVQLTAFATTGAIAVLDLLSSTDQ
jgi:hypothetical protein